MLAKSQGINGAKERRRRTSSAPCDGPRKSLPAVSPMCWMSASHQLAQALIRPGTEVQAAQLV